MVKNLFMRLRLIKQDYDDFWRNRLICALKGCDIRYSSGGYNLPDDYYESECKRCGVVYEAAQRATQHDFYVGGVVSFLRVLSGFLKDIHINLFVIGLVDVEEALGEI